MTDYFVLLQQPRQPWIDPEELEEKYHELARKTHPDQLATPGHDFTEVNQAYRTLRDPRLRLHHLLALTGHPLTSSPTQVPADLANLFAKIAAGLTKNNREELDLLKNELRDHYEIALEQLRGLNDAWAKDPLIASSDAIKLYRCFAFLTRWKEHLDEKSFFDSS